MEKLQELLPEAEVTPEKIKAARKYYAEYFS
jgi:hypothetical protein